MNLRLPEKGAYKSDQNTDEVYGEAVTVIVHLLNGEEYILQTTMGQTIAQVKKKLSDNRIVVYNEVDLYFPGTMAPLIEPFSLNDIPTLASAHAAGDPLHMIVRQKADGRPTGPQGARAVVKSVPDHYRNAQYPNENFAQNGNAYPEGNGRDERDDDYFPQPRGPVRPQWQPPQQGQGWQPPQSHQQRRLEEQQQQQQQQKSQFQQRQIDPQRSSDPYAGRPLQQGRYGEDEDQRRHPQGRHGEENEDRYVPHAQQQQQQQRQQQMHHQIQQEQQHVGYEPPRGHRDEDNGPRPGSRRQEQHGLAREDGGYSNSPARSPAMTKDGARDRLTSEQGGNEHDDSAVGEPGNEKHIRTLKEKKSGCRCVIQ